MRRALGIAIGATLALALPPADGASAAPACADIFPAMSFGPLPAEAETTPFFSASEGAGTGSFNVWFTGIDCGFRLETTAAQSDTPGSADGADYNFPEGRTPPVCGTPQPGCPYQQTISFPVAADPLTEGVVESFTIVLSDPWVNGQQNPSALSPPTSLPFFIADDDGLVRASFDDLSYSRTESHATLTVPVWKAGSGPAEVPYTLGPGPGSPATANEDYKVTSPNPLVFGPGDHVKTITLSIVNDKAAEPEETVQFALQGPAVAPATKVVKILDNEEGIAPTSRLHHPRHKWRYKKGDFRIREVHVFAHDNEGGSGVVGADLALRRNLGNGDCLWWTGGRWDKKDCSNREWVTMKYSKAGDLFLYRMKQLKSSIGTPIKNYTAYSRAIDGAGNVEKQFNEKRNANTFEVKRGQRRR